MNPSATELTTAATDAALGILCLVLLARLQQMPTAFPLKKTVWTWVFKLAVLASALGAVAHGLDLSETVRNVLWHPLYLALGLSVALFLVAAVADWKGERMARTLLPWAVAVGVAFYASTQLLSGAFFLFVAYEAIALVSALGIYGYLGGFKRYPGASLVSAGIVLSLAAAVVQATPVSVRLFVPFDHNGLFHLVQMIAMIVLAAGLRRSLERTMIGASASE